MKSRETGEDAPLLYRTATSRPNRGIFGEGHKHRLGCLCEPSSDCPPSASIEDATGDGPSQGCLGESAPQKVLCSSMPIRQERAITEGCRRAALRSSVVPPCVVGSPSAAAPLVCSARHSDAPPLSLLSAERFEHADRSLVGRSVMQSPLLPSPLRRGVAGGGFEAAHGWWWCNLESWTLPHPTTPHPAASPPFASKVGPEAAHDGPTVFRCDAQSMSR